jgi:hypothetical protein
MAPTKRRFSTVYEKQQRDTKNAAMALMTMYEPKKLLSLGAIKDSKDRKDRDEDRDAHEDRKDHDHKDYAFRADIILESNKPSFSALGALEQIIEWEDKRLRMDQQLTKLRKNLH